MEEDNTMKFHQQLLAIDDNLGKEDVDALKFLCSDFISLKKLETVESAQDIFQLLMKKNLLNKEDTFLLAELLYRIKCIFLLQKIGYTKEEVQDKLPLRGMVSEYRQMLYEISEGLTEEDVKNATFLLRDHIPKKQSTTSALELLTSLEKQDLLAKTKTDKLEIICEKISPDLLKKVERYKQRTASHPSHPGFQESSFWESSVGYPPKKSADSYTEELGSLRWHNETLHSLPANQDVRAGNASGPSELHLPRPMGDEKSKSSAKTSDCYKMDGPHRGYCLIFNNINFEGGLTRRTGSQKDALGLENVFTWLGLEVKKYDDKTSVEMENILKDWQSSESWKDKDCLVCCILSHGESGKIYGTDACLISIRTIMSYFTAKRCPQLAKKPKLFFIQACQGEKTQQPVYLETDTNNRANLGADAQSSGFSSLQLMTLSIPEEADFLLGMATVDGYLSFRHIHQGTWYIQALCDKLRALVPRGEDILSILTEVNADVSKRADAQGQKKQMPQPAYTLRKKLIFPMPK
ncbi:caspase-10 [Sceloporus undulatus]|uniref:caspase-10 n=1 Tax=Sceloporus undulatus TaxID=8520 RepID=UPI001C4C9747|nr:caspase-10 [Sceloporus undulatus]XP_042331409.1 caspase-10 [Sceloporus undulatus]